MARLLLIALMVFSLVPALGEVVEAVAHRVTTGHFAHSVPEENDLPGGDEHGCTPIAHHCGCCASQPISPPVAERVQTASVRTAETLLAIQAEDAAPRDGFRHQPYRPPIS